MIEDPPPLQSRNGQDPRSYHIVVCSARTSKSLLENQRRLYDFVKAHPHIRLSDLSYTTTARRLHHAIRRSYYSTTVKDLVEQLGADLSRSPSLLIEPSKTIPSVVFTFTGQGSIYPGMGKQLFESCSRFRGSLFSYQKICDSHSLPQVLDIFTHPTTDLSLKSTVQIQLAMVFLELAMADLLMSWGVRPSLLIGHSLGEYAAMCVSGVLSVTDTLYLVGKRAALLQERCTSGTYAMLAVGASMEQLKLILSTAQFNSCEVACINSPNKTVVSGPVKHLQAFRDRTQSEKFRTTFLEITYGFHSPQVEPILHDFKYCAEALHFARPAIPIASTLLAGKIVKEEGVFSPDYLARQAREPVNFAGTLQACAEAGLTDASTIWFEIGPEPVNLSMIRSTLNVSAKSLLPTLKSSEEDWKSISHALSAAYTSAITVDWTEYHKEYVSELSLLELPTYAFDLKNYWASYSTKPAAPTQTSVNVPTKSKPDSFVPSTTLQTLQEILQTKDGVSALFSSALSEPMLLASIKGHQIDGTALCPASVFCDMAFAAAKHIFTRYNPEEIVSTIVLEDLVITHPLVAAGKDVLQQTVEVNACRTHKSELVKVSFGSRDAGSSSIHEHGSCSVRLAEAVTLREKHHGSSVEAKEKLDSLVASAKTGKHLRLPKLIAYKLFANLVKYDAAYQSMDEVYLDSYRKDAATSVRLVNSQDSGTFACNPYWTDAVIHLAGFILNGDVTKPDNIAYISTGFKKLFILEPLKQSTEYACFSTIQAEDKKGVSCGDVYVFQEQSLVAVCAGITFQKMTKNVLGVIMGKSEVSTRSNTNEQSPDSNSPDDSSVGHASTAATSASGRDALQMAQTLLQVVASETGYSVEDMEPSASFADMGVDSLMSIAIVSAVKQKTGVELPGSFFAEHPTVADVTNEFAADDASGFVSASQSPRLSMERDDDAAKSPNIPALIEELDSEGMAKNDGGLSDLDSTGPSADKPIQTPVDLSGFTSRAVLVQGRAMSKATPLFLVADGAGSAAAYIHLPPLPSGGKIYALESPFVGDPSKFAGSIEDIATLYLTALRKAQPEGPYILGGWSAGAVYAYEVTRQLLAQGETVMGLILIDMRVPKPMPDGIEPTIELVEEAGLVMGLTRAGQSVSTVSKVTKQHLLETVKRLMVYKPIGMDPLLRPAHTCLIWAKKGLKERHQKSGPAVKEEEPEPEPEMAEEDNPYFGNIMEDPNTGLRSWFYAKRTNFGPNGWDKLVGDVDIHTIDGDHFSIVTPPHVSEILFYFSYEISSMQGGVNRLTTSRSKLWDRSCERRWRRRRSRRYRWCREGRSSKLIFCIFFIEAQVCMHSLEI